MNDYTQQLQGKKDYLKTLFAGLDVPEWEVYESPDKHYRMRAEFRIWHEGGEMFYAMFEKGQKASGASLIRCDRFDAASEAVNCLMPELIAVAAQSAELETALQNWAAAAPGREVSDICRQDYPLPARQDGRVWWIGSSE